MKKYLNFHNFGIACFVALVVIVLCSFTGSYNIGYRKYSVEEVRVNGCRYIVATTYDGGIAICTAK